MGDFYDKERGQRSACSKREKSVLGASCFFDFFCACFKGQILVIILALCIYGIACDGRVIHLVNLFISACDKKIVTLLSDKMYVLNIYNTSFSQRIIF